MSSVTILCPNGRRQTIKVSPNKTILQILEEVCQKRGFEPVLHDLKHGRNTLDVGSTFRFSGVPNNGKLELVPRDKPRSLESEITIALTLESGERRQKTVKADTTLADMVRHFQQNDENLLTNESNKQPVVINMREEIVGIESLELLTLQSIGLVSGRVALRLVHRVVEDEVLARISADLRTKKQKEESKSSVGKVPADVSVTGETVAASRTNQVKKAQSSQPMDVSPQVATELAAEEQKVKPTAPISTAAIDDADSETAMQITPTDLTSFLSGSQSAAPTLNAQDVRPKHAVQTPSTPEQPAQAAPAQAAPAQTAPAAPAQAAPAQAAPAQAAPSQTAPSQTAPAQAAPAQTAPPQMQPVVPEFKFPEATAGKDLYRNELSDAQSSDFLPCERDAVVFSLKEPTVESSISSPDDISDDFFEVTKADLQKMIRDLREQASREENAPLMTSSMRQAMLESSFDSYQYAIIRFYFHDQTVLQAKFRPRETVHSLTKFVQAHLKNKQQSFYLYTTPPKQVLNDAAATLLVARLVPMAIVYVSSSVPSEVCLTDEMTSHTTTRVEADRLTKLSLPKEPQLKVEKEIKTKEETKSSTGAAAPSSVQPSGSKSNTSATVAATSKQVPKWYKPSGR